MEAPKNDNQEEQIHPVNGDFILSDAEIKEVIRRKEDFSAGKTTSKPWDEIKKQYS